VITETHHLDSVTILRLFLFILPGIPDTRQFISVALV
jgi:hypothetical protein